MNEKKLMRSIVEAEAFLKEARKLLADSKENSSWLYTSTVLRGNVRRNSMDLTRSLAKLRSYKEI